MAEVPPPQHSPSPPRPAAPANGVEDSGQWPVLKVDLREMKRSLSLQNVAVFLGIATIVLGALSAAGAKVGGWWVGDAVAADARFQDHERRIGRVEGEVSALRGLAVRQLEEGRANAEYLATGRKPAILLEPLPAVDGGQ